MSRLILKYRSCTHIYIFHIYILYKRNTSYLDTSNNMVFWKQQSSSSVWQQRMKRYMWAIKRRGRKTKFIRQKIKIQHTLKTQKVKEANGHVWKRNELTKTNGLKLQQGLLVLKINSHGGEGRGDRLMYTDEG